MVHLDHHTGGATKELVHITYIDYMTDKDGKMKIEILTPIYPKSSYKQE